MAPSWGTVKGNLKSGTSSYLKDLVGNHSQATIMIWDYRKYSQQVDEATGDKARMSELALSGGIQSLFTAKQRTDTVKLFTVQFNPSELKINATSPEVSHASLAQDSDTPPATTTPSVPTVELSVKLIFDKMNIEDAFLFDKYSTFASAQAVTNLVTAGLKSKAGATWSVQPVVEGFIAALRNRYTRSITFAWSDFEFGGVLKTVGAEYTMFSPSGRPIRAEVSLRLQQEMFKQNIDSWKADFRNAFGANGGVNSLVTRGQKMGNLLNLNI